MVPRAGFEPAAFSLGGRRSILLSYRGTDLDTCQFDIRDNYDMLQARSHLDCIRGANLVPIRRILKANLQIILTYSTS